MIKDIISELKKVRHASRELSTLSEDNTSQILRALAGNLRASIPEILSENKKIFVKCLRQTHVLTACY